MHELSTPGFTRRARKFVVALLGILGQLVLAGLLPDPWNRWAAFVVAAATAAGVYGARNSSPETSLPETSSPTSVPEPPPGS